MDFARPHNRTESLASKSNIRLVDVKADDPPTLDQLVLEAANQSARDVLLGGLPADQDSWVDASLYTERLIPRKESIQLGDLVVIVESFDRLTFAYVEEKGVYSNRNGNFHHKDFIGKPFGCKVRSTNNQGYGFCYLLKPTPELWARSLNHRTQIVHELDQSQIIFQLNLRPNMTVVESGTGSGAMSHAILRTIAPHGQLHTYEFNKARAEAAREEFKSNGVGHLVTTHHRDVCADKHGEKGGFDLPENSVDAAFLDLPEPWVAVPHAAFCLKPNARIASYSPCVEQTQKTVAALEAAGFHSLKTMEYRLQEHYVDEVEYERPPRAKRPKLVTNPLAKAGREKDDDKVSAEEVDERAKNEEPSETFKEKSPDDEQEKHVVARPFVMMRGHSAFLTFATAGNESQPNPNAKPEEKK